MEQNPKSSIPSAKLAIVTGTSSGIGAATVAQLLVSGWTVIGLSRREGDFSNPNYTHLTVDLTVLDQLQRAAENEVAPVLRDPKWRRIGLINNAAWAGYSVAMEAAEPQDVATAFAINTVAPMFLMGLITRHAPTSTPVRIINVSSGVAVRAFPGVGDYGSSKAALRMASMVFSEEMQSTKRPGGARPDTAVLSYAPGVVATEMQDSIRRLNGPWVQPFVDFHEKGLLQPATGPAREMADWLDSDPSVPFAEKRFGAV